MPELEPLAIQAVYAQASDVMCNELGDTGLFGISISGEIRTAAGGCPAFQQQENG